MKLPKKDKADKPKPVKPARAPKEKSTAPDPFWVVWNKKRLAKKLPKRAKSLPEKPISKEDRIKLIIAGVIAVLVPITFWLLSQLSNRPAPPPK